MQSPDSWKPGKYVIRSGRLTASRDSSEVSPGSRLIADILAGFYEKHLPTHAKGRLLDLGCGKVPLYLAYRDIVTENICLDWENSLHRNPHLDYRCDLKEPLPFKENEFDTVILSDVLEHIPNPEVLMSEISRMLRPGGILLLNVPFFYWIHEEPHDFFRYTEFALRFLTEQAGLEVVSLEPLGGAPEILTDVYAKNIIRLPLLGKPLSLFSQWFTGLLLKTPFCRAVSRSTAKKFPLGYFMIARKEDG